ncbi:MAG: glycerophosphodiester phosphodiesterase [Rhodocyclaceae bacterium]
MPRPASLPDWPWPAVMAHRCGGALAPENTLAGLRVCRNLGCGGVEFDVMLTRDGTPILMHDETLPRTTNGEGRVLDHGDAYLWTLDAGIRHHVSFAGEPIPRFAQAIERCRALDLAANVEIKPCGGHERQTGEVVARLARQGWEGAAVPPLLSSFSLDALRAAAAAAPELPRGWLTDRIPTDWQVIAQDLGVIAVHTNSLHLTETQAASIKAAGYRLAVYTENDPQQARLLRNWGVDTLITDRPDLIRA